jgi:H+/gluconate symporter-like permease
VPLLIVAVTNGLLTYWLPQWYGTTSLVVLRAGSPPIAQQLSSVVGVWAVTVALALGIVSVWICAFRRVKSGFLDASRVAVSACVLGALNTASEFGFGSVISALPGFTTIQAVLRGIPNPLFRIAVTVTTLAGITGSAAGGLSIALAAMSKEFLALANANGISVEVLHRVAVMAAGGMDTLPHNGAIIMLLMITGLTHQQAYPDIFAITCLKTIAAFVVVLVYFSAGVV